MTVKRQKRSASFKFKVALEAAQGSHCHSVICEIERRKKRERVFKTG